MQEPRARHSASSTATATQPARWHRSPRPHEASTNVPHIDRKISTRPFSSCRPSWPNVAASAWALQCSTSQVDISRQLAGQQNLLRRIVRWRRRFPLAAKATGSNPDGGKGAQGASTGLDLPRACLERSLSAATRGGADPLFRSCRGGLPLPGVSRGSPGPWIRRLRRRQRSRQGRRHAGADAPCWLSSSSSSSLLTVPVFTPSRKCSFGPVWLGGPNDACASRP